MRIYYELEVGERITIDREYECIAGHDCCECDADRLCDTLVCEGRQRLDSVSVMFKEVR